MAGDPHTGDLFAALPDEPAAPATEVGIAAVIEAQAQATDTREAFEEAEIEVMRRKGVPDPTREWTDLAARAAHRCERLRALSTGADSKDASDAASADDDGSRKGQIVALALAGPKDVQLAIFSPGGNAYAITIGPDTPGSPLGVRQWWTFARRNYFWLVRDAEQAAALGLVEASAGAPTDEAERPHTTRSAPEPASEAVTETAAEATDTAAGDDAPKRAKAGFSGRMLARSRRDKEALRQLGFEDLLAYAESQAEGWRRKK